MRYIDPYSNDIGGEVVCPKDRFHFPRIVVIIVLIPCNGEATQNVPDVQSLRSQMFNGKHGPELVIVVLVPVCLLGQLLSGLSPESLPDLQTYDSNGNSGVMKPAQLIQYLADMNQDN